ncbi:hypothetical protein H8356DRAFT_1322401 [Neocallimastix lanati (nom. inval.)]|nr:hypothetical protein H8356DRAFT_1322401 [Neocallimastix sp. JGI-2020a]
MCDKLSSIFWDEAIKCELCLNKKIDLFKLKIFECKVFFLKKYKQGNFENNTKTGVFLIYSSDSPGFFVLGITSKLIIISHIHDAYFNKNSLGLLSTECFFSHSSNSSDKQIEGKQHLQQQFNFIDVMNEYNNENIDNNEIQNYKNNHFFKIEIKFDQKLAENHEEILKNLNIEEV